MELDACWPTSVRVVVDEPAEAELVNLLRDQADLCGRVIAVLLDRGDVPEGRSRSRLRLRLR